MSVVVARRRYVRTKDFRKVHSRDRETITCGTLDFFGRDVSLSLFVTHHIHPLLSHLVAVLSVYELGARINTSPPLRWLHQLADRVNPRLARCGNWMTPSSLRTCGTRRISRQHDRSSVCVLFHVHPQGEGGRIWNFVRESSLLVSARGC